MARGRVKSFDPKKGFGFLITDEVDEDVFVHQTKIEMEGFRTLEANQEVEFEIVATPKGLSAENVMPL